MIVNILRRIFKDIEQCKYAIVIFAIYNVVVRTLFHAFCPFLIFFGIPCAGCGLTRACICILRLQFERSMNLNPAAPLWMALIIYFILFRYVLGKKVKGIEPLIGVVSVITLLIYIYRMLTEFPGYPPMVINGNNIMSKIFPLYNERLHEIVKSNIRETGGVLWTIIH